LRREFDIKTNEFFSLSKKTHSKDNFSISKGFDIKDFLNSPPKSLDSPV